ncbi:hypothetical protein FUAX_29990 [Fulvitalea axinellae]|uniref:Uncharacterized protein n=1 Tax=Fulvitalea axinellae TaxID=1182444 RepID=A0AAU9CYM4_9BACT|nr:hypothetical protein FUAX_29990 [Fulvitalea axinellae]
MLDPEKMLPPSSYPDIASNLKECQSFLDRKNSELKHLTLRLINQENHAKAKDTQAEKMISRLESMKTEHDSCLQLAEMRKETENVKKKHEAQAMIIDAEMKILKLRMSKTPKVDAVIRNEEIYCQRETLNAKRLAVELYIENYVMSGVLGSGILSFLDKTYAVGEKTNPSDTPNMRILR